MLRIKRRILLFAALLISNTCCIFSQTDNVCGLENSKDSIDYMDKLYLNHNPLVVIDGLIIEDNPAITFNCDSLNTFVSKICPIIQENDIDYINFIDELNIGCRPGGSVIVVGTKPESGIDCILLNGHVSKRKNKVKLTNFVLSKTPKFSLLEKKWNLDKITLLKIHANGKEVIDNNNNKHIIFVEVETN